MTTYTSVFGGNAVQPSDLSLSRITLSANETLSWPVDGGSPVTSAIIEVNATAGGYTITLPDARRAGNGETITFRNTGANSFSVLDNAGGSVTTIASGLVYTIYLSDNSSAAGSWAFWQAGAGTSTASADALDGAGLDASAGLLRVRATTSSFSASQAFSDGDRGGLAVWTGGSGSFSVPLAASVGNGWYMNFKNAGSGTLQIVSVGGETFDGASDITLAVNEGAAVYCAGTNFSFVRYTSGSGAVSSFAYTSISVAGTGDYTLSAAEYGKTALKFTGVLTGNRNIIVPASARDYWVNNATSGAFTLTVKTAAGSGVAVTQGKKATVYCDGVDVIAADNDYPSGIATPVSVANGGTGATVAATALTNLGGTATGTSVFTAASAAAGRSALSAAASGANTDISSVTLGNTGLKVRDTDASNLLSIVPGSNLSADRTFTLITGDAARTLNISAADVTISAAAATVLDDASVSAMLATMGGAPLASPALTGTPTAPTAAGGTNTTQIATTAFVTAAIAATGSSSIYTSGSGNYTIPSGVTFIYARLWGAGGSGSTASALVSAGGGGGAYKEYVYRASDLGGAGATVAYSVGTGGAASTAATGNAGQNTSFGSLIAYGGGGATGTGSPGTGGAFFNAGSGSDSGFGGTAANGANASQQWGGAQGGSGNSTTGGAALYGGGGGGGRGNTSVTNGGSSYFGGAGGNTPASGAGNAGTAPGGGGSGAATNGSASGAGGAGRIEVYAW